MLRYPPLSLSLFVLVAISTATVGAVHGTETASHIEEVIVTAEFRDTNINSLAASASVIRPNESGTVVNHLEEVLGQAANVNFASGASRARFIQIRGIGERGQFADPLNSSVGLIVDGVDLSGVGTAATLFDVQQVEVLRGPQGTLYGANALAGLINVVTPPPTSDHTASLRMDAGDYGAFGIGGVVSGPLAERAGYRVSVQRYADDGFMDNDFLGRDDTAEHEESTYRAKLVWQGDVSQWYLSVGHVDIDNGYDAFSLDNNRRTLSDDPGRDLQETDYAALQVNTDLSSQVRFEASVSFAESDIDYGYDEDWTYSGFDPIGYTSTDRYRRDRETVTTEGRFLSQPGQGVGGVWDWVAGVYLLQQNVGLVRDYTFLAAPFESDFEMDRIAIYGEVSRQVSDHWRLTLGARFEQHDSEYDDSLGVSFKPDDDLVGGRILLERDFDDGSFLYAGVTQGYKSGGFNTDGSLDADLREFDTETLWNIEIGYKAKFLDERLALRSALFRMQRDDIQISTSTQRPIPNSSAVQFIVYTGNAAEGYNQGIEAELEFAASERLTLFANVGLLDSEYADYVDNSGRNLDGREQAHAPTYQFFAGGEYAFTERWSARIEVEGKDEYFFSASHAAKSDSYQLINASLGYAADKWSVRLWGRNLADEDYQVRGFQFGNDPRDFYTTRPFTQLGAPSQIGISVQASL